MVAHARWAVAVASIGALASCANPGQGTGSTAGGDTPPPATTAPAATTGPTTAPDTPSFAGAIYLGKARGTGSRTSVQTATAAVGYQVYVRPRGAADWIGPEITDTYGRFVFTSLAPGPYQARAYAGPVRVWEQIVNVPSVLPRIVARDVVVIYYAKDSDKGQVEAALESLGFPYERRKPLNFEPTNAIFFGTGVPVDDVRSLATALVQAHVPIRSIRYFADSSGPKSKQIEIEADKRRKRDPLFTADRIASAHNFAHF
jgi:hypothetical protein